MPAPRNPATSKKLGATLSRKQGNRLPAKAAEGTVTYAELAQEVGLTSSAISYKIRRGMSVAEIRAEGARRAAAQANGTLMGKAKQAGVPKSFYAARKAEAVPTSTPAIAPVKHQSRQAAASPNEELHSAATRKEIALANLKEIEEQQKRGELIGTEYVKAYMGSCIIRAREVWMGIRDLSDRIRQEPDAIKAQQIIDEEVRRGLGELEKFGEMLVQKAKGGGSGSGSGMEAAA